MARCEPDHARRGANLLRELHMPQMAELVATHMEMPYGKEQQIREAEVMFLADKLILEDRFVGLVERFRHRQNNFVFDSQAQRNSRRRLCTARNLAERIEAIIGRPLQSLLDGCRMASTV
jgi:hypothetical protein